MLDIGSSRPSKKFRHMSFFGQLLECLELTVLSLGYINVAIGVIQEQRYNFAKKRKNLRTLRKQRLMRHLNLQSIGLEFFGRSGDLIEQPAWTVFACSKVCRLEL